MLNSETPSVSVLIPALNEKDHIEQVVGVFQKSAYPNVIEILVADGGSTDGTQEIVLRMSREDNRVQLMDNPDRIQSAALNRMIAQAKGEVMLRADAHCEYDANYVEACIEALKQSGSVSVGGAQRFVAKNPVQAGISLIVRTLLGSGNAKYRDESYSGFADTVFLGCFLKEVFQKVGVFTPLAHPNEDTELNIRILKQWPEGVYVSHAIKAWYFPRTTLKRLWQQYFLYGRARVITRALHPEMVGWRASFPFISLMCILMLLCVEVVVLSSAWLVGSIVLALAALFLLTAIRISLATRTTFNTEIWRSSAPPPGLLSRIWYATVCGITLNVAHAFGYAREFFFSWMK